MCEINILIFKSMYLRTYLLFKRTYLLLNGTYLLFMETYPYHKRYRSTCTYVHTQHVHPPSPVTEDTELARNRRVVEVMKKTIEKQKLL